MNHVFINQDFKTDVEEHGNQLDSVTSGIIIRSFRTKCRFNFLSSSQNKKGLKNQTKNTVSITSPDESTTFAFSNLGSLSDTSTKPVIKWCA